MEIRQSGIVFFIFNAFSSSVYSQNFEDEDENEQDF